MRQLYYKLIFPYTSTIAFLVGEIITRQDGISSVQSKINAPAISFLLTVENIQHHIIIY